MKTLPLALALTSSSLLASEKPTELPIVQNTQSQMRKIVSTEASPDKDWTQAIIILGGLLLGSALASWTDSEYRKRTPPEKRISARVLKKLWETDI